MELCPKGGEFDVNSNQPSTASRNSRNDKRESLNSLVVSRITKFLPDEDKAGPKVCTKASIVVECDAQDVCVCMCVRACVRACVRVCVRACVRAFVAY